MSLKHKEKIKISRTFVEYIPGDVTNKNLKVIFMVEFLCTTNDITCDIISPGILYIIITYPFNHYFNK